MLTGFFGGARAWYDMILNPGGSDEWTGATGEAEAVTDAVSAATGAVVEGGGEVATSVGTAIINWDFLGLFQTILVSGKELAESTISDLAFKLNVPLIDWFIDTLILPNDSVQIFMQSSIVILEIVIGLALIGGLFTFPAAGVSLVLQFMFVSTTGLYLGTFWMIFAGIAVLIGGGRTFGLDYYALPALKNGWKKLGWVRKLYIYND
jgi:NADH dehydrogenase